MNIWRIVRSTYRRYERASKRRRLQISSTHAIHADVGSDSADMLRIWDSPNLGVMDRTSIGVVHDDRLADQGPKLLKRVEKDPMASVYMASIFVRPARSPMTSKFGIAKMFTGHWFVPITIALAKSTVAITDPPEFLIIHVTILAPWLAS